MEGEPSLIQLCPGLQVIRCKRHEVSPRTLAPLVIRNTENEGHETWWRFLITCNLGDKCTNPVSGVLCSRGKSRFSPTLFPGSFVFPQEGVVDHSLLWEDERPWERGWIFATVVFLVPRVEREDAGDISLTMLPAGLLLPCFGQTGLRGLEWHRCKQLPITFLTILSFNSPVRDYYPFSNSEMFPNELSLNL